MQRGLTISEAAALCGVTPATYREWEKAGRVPKPWPGTKRYDRKAIEISLDRLSGIQEQSSPYDKWKQGRNNEDHGAARS